jgi:hypothetical protein
MVTRAIQNRIGRTTYFGPGKYLDWPHFAQPSQIGDQLIDAFMALATSPAMSSCTHSLSSDGRS